MPETAERRPAPDWLSANGRLAFATLIGGSGDDQATAVTMDVEGEIIIAGKMPVPDFLIQTGTASLATDAFVAKFTARGELVYCTYLGGSAYAIATAVAADKDGNAYVEGWTNSQDFPTTAGAMVASAGVARAGKRSIFVTKLSPQGNALVYSTLLGSGSAYDAPGPLAVDAAGSVLVAGTNESKEFASTPGAVRPTSGGPFLAKLNATGTQYVYATGLISDQDAPSSLALDTAGNVYIAGTTFDVTPRGPNALMATNPGREVFKATGAGWTALPGLDNKVVLALIADPANSSILYAGTEDGVWKSSDGGSSWSAIAATGPVGSIVLDPVDSRHLFFSTPGLPSILSSDVYESRDAGTTWTHRTATTANEIVFDPKQPANVYGVEYQGFWYSRDGGQTWTEVSSAKVNGNPRPQYAWTIPAIDPSNPNTIYEATQDGILKSTDSGATWQSVSLGYASALAVDPGNSKTIYGVLGGALNIGVLEKSVDGGVTWTSLPNSLQNVTGIRFDPGSAGGLYVFTRYGTFKTVDGGSSFVSLSNPANTAVQWYLFSGANSDPLYALSSQPAEGFVTKVSLDGRQALFSTYFGAAGAVSIKALAVDGSGIVHLAGVSSSPQLPQALTAPSGTSDDAFVGKLTGDGQQLLFTQVVGGGNTESVGAVAVDPQGNTAIVGGTSSPDLSITSDALQRTLSPTGYSGYYGTLDANGNVRSVSYFGGSKAAAVEGVAFDAAGRLVTVGFTESDDFQTTRGAIQRVLNGLSDGFLAIVNLP